MAAKKDNLPLNVDNDTTPTNTITYANEVIAIIAGVAANEVEGIAGMSTASGIDILGRKNVTKGVKVEIGTEEASVDLYIVVEYGTPIQKAAQDAQENVRKAIETMTGLHVVRVDVHVQGVSFEKENNAIEAGQEQARLNSGAKKTETTPVRETKVEAVKPEPPKAEAVQEEAPAVEEAPEVQQEAEQSEEQTQE